MYVYNFIRLHLSAHKIAKNWTLPPLFRKMSVLTQPPSSVRTHHKFQKIWCFYTKKCGRPHLKNPRPLSAKCPH